MRRSDTDGNGDAPLVLYEPTRVSKLRAGQQPPPLPPVQEADEQQFGIADEDGLRMLAALETLTSLEPDYSVEATAEEASVTIIEAFDYDTVAEALGAGDPCLPRAQWRAHEGASPLLLNGYETFTGFGDEATIEIVDAGPEFADAAAEARPAPRPASLSERLAGAGRRPRGRFFKALSGD